MEHWYTGVDQAIVDEVNGAIRAEFGMIESRIDGFRLPEPCGVVLDETGARHEIPLAYLDDVWRSLPVEQFEEPVRAHREAARIAVLICEKHGMGKSALGIRVAHRDGAWVGMIQRYGFCEVGGPILWYCYYTEPGELALFREGDKTAG